MFFRKKTQRFETYLDRLFGYALAMSRDKELAADLVQDCVLRVMKARNIPKDEAAYRSWLFTIIRNLWFDYLRSSKRHALVEPLNDSHEEIVTEDFETTVVNVVAVRQAFEDLTVEHRDILALVDIGGFSYDETSKMLNIPKGTVMSRISRARATLAGLLNDDNVVEMKSHAKREKL